MFLLFLNNIAVFEWLHYNDDDCPIGPIQSTFYFKWSHWTPLLGGLQHNLHNWLLLRLAPSYNLDAYSHPYLHASTLRYLDNLVHLEGENGVIYLACGIR